MENKTPNGGSALLFGILSILFCETVVLGLVFGFLGKAKAKAYAKVAGQLKGKAKAGKILSIIGILFSVLSIIGCFLLFCLYALTINNAYAG